MKSLLLPRLGSIAHEVRTIGTGRYAGYVIREHHKEYPRVSIRPLDDIRDRLVDLLRDAAQQGIIITVDLESREPLAMGNYNMVGRVRLAR